MKLPAPTPVIVTEQPPDESSVQLTSTAPIVVADEVKLTVPVGIFAALIVSTTEMLHEPVRPTVNEEEQETVVEVMSNAGADTVMVPEVPELGL